MTEIKDKAYYVNNVMMALTEMLIAAAYGEIEIERHEDDTIESLSYALTGKEIKDYMKNVRGRQSEQL